MERVAFLVEESGERIRCLLNPETLVVRRSAGVQTRRAAAGLLSGTQLTDNPLLFTGGGSTELQLDLLFDISLAGSSISTDNVRDLTRPLWNLAENSGGDRAARRPPRVRFLWGKVWDVPAVVVAVAEKLEQFGPDGAPHRSWMRLRLLRVGEAAPERLTRVPALPAAAASSPPSTGLRAPDLRVHPIVGGIVPSPQGLQIVSLPGRPAFELSLLDASLTAGGIIMAALAETQTAAALAGALQGVGEVVAAAVEQIRARTEALVTAIGDSPAIRALRDGAVAAGAAVSAALSAIGEELQAAYVSAASALSAASVAARAHLGALASEAQAAVAARVAAVSAELRPVANALREAALTMAAGVRDALGDVADTPAARAFVGATRRLVEAVETFIQSDSVVLESMQALAGAAGRALGEIRRGAVALGGEAAQRVAAALEELEPLGAELRTGSANVAAFVAEVALEPIQAAFTDVGNVAGAFVEAAAIVAPAVKARAVRVMGSGARHLQAALDDVHGVLQAGGSASAAGLREAARVAIAASDEAVSELRQLFEEGRLAGPHLLRSLASIGAASEALWLAGGGQLQRRVQGPLQLAVVAAKQIDAAGEALGAVSFATARAPVDHWRQTLAQTFQAPAPEDGEPAPSEEPAPGDDPGATIVSARPRPAAALEEPGTPDEPVVAPQTPPMAIGELQAPAAALATAVAALRPTTGVEAGNQLSAAARQLRAQIDAVPGNAHDDAAEDVRAALKELHSALETAAAEDEEATAGQVVAAVSGAGAPAPQFSATDVVTAGALMATHRAHIGERLDQLAYRYFGNAQGWRLLALANEIDHPLRLEAGRMLRIPALSES